MKKLFLLIFAACAAISFAACSDDSDEGAVPKLKTPVVKFEIVSAKAIRVSWQRVENAGAYTYVVDNRAGQDVVATEVTIDPQGAISCTVTVTAVSADKSLYLDSEPARVTISGIPAPEEPVLIGFEGAELGTEGYIWGKEMATEQDDVDYQGNPTRSNIYYGSLWTEAEAQVWTYFSDSGHQYDTWNGFVVSNHHDMDTEGYLNDKSVYAEGGAQGSKQFAMAFHGAWTPAPKGVPVIKFTKPVTPQTVEIANSTYVYLYFKNDVATAVKPDFTAVITGYNGTTKTQAVSVPLVSGETLKAGWESVNLSSLGEVTSLEFTVTCADERAPYYFCVDNLKYLK